jgi:hypothetical protein
VIPSPLLDGRQEIPAGLTAVTTTEAASLPTPLLHSQQTITHRRALAEELKPVSLIGLFVGEHTLCLKGVM